MARRSPAFKEGDKVWYRGGFGLDAPQAAIITGRGSKNGMTIFDCTIKIKGQADDNRWGYADQFERRT